MGEIKNYVLLLVVCDLVVGLYIDPSSKALSQEDIRSLLKDETFHKFDESLKNARLLLVDDMVELQKRVDQTLKLSEKFLAQYSNFKFGESPSINTNPLKDLYILPVVPNQSKEDALKTYWRRAVDFSRIIVWIHRRETLLLRLSPSKNRKNFKRIINNITQINHSLHMVFRELKMMGIRELNKVKSVLVAHNLDSMIADCIKVSTLPSSKTFTGSTLGRRIETENYALMVSLNKFLISLLPAMKKLPSS